ncbi:MAG: ATPase, T2SS/T4P/T4SS family [Bdellovibrionaceae bacterium]|nr:ATPase, T2SS/T4P/T4SS family [Pseudobdellovibrionaceae bacterium]MDW8190015.1 ATPase, T2SS/T4P/T4SS family [Pseudobdellovibrionaceae bacterium]
MIEAVPVTTPVCPIRELVQKFEQEFGVDSREVFLFQHEGIALPSETFRLQLEGFIRYQPIPVQERIRKEFFGWGPLEDLLVDPSVTEIMVNAYDQVWVERQGCLTPHHDTFATPASYQNFLVRFFSLIKKNFSVEDPIIEGTFGRFRVHFVGQELSPGSPKLCLRCQPEIPWTLDSLLQMGWCEESAIPLLRQIIRERRNFLVVGSTGSGKTSLINALLREMPSDERIIIIEDTSELQCPNGVSMKLLTREAMGDGVKSFSQLELLKSALRLRPDRLVLGEMRGAEAKDFLLALSTGHEGSGGSLHASSAAQALLRLEMLIQIGAPQWSLAAVRRLIALSLQFIIVVERKTRGFRQLQGIHQVASWEENGLTLNTCYQGKGHGDLVCR